MNNEIAKMRVENAMLRLKLGIAQVKGKQLKIEEAKAKFELAKINAEFDKTLLKF